MVVGSAAFNQAVAASPISETIWEGTVVSRPFSTQRIQMENDVKANIKGADDDYAIRVVADMIGQEIAPSQETVSFGGGRTCQSNTDYFSKRLEAAVMQLAESVKYQTKRTNVNPSIKNSISTIRQGNNSYLKQLSVDIIWAMNYGIKVDASGKINVLATINCDNKNDIVFKVSVPDHSIKNPNFPGFLPSGELWVDWGRVKTIMDSLHKEYVVVDGKQEYTNYVDSVVSKINHKLEHRFEKFDKDIVKSNEHTYKVAFDVISSRIQRRLEAFKYETERTRYEFAEKMVVHGIDTAPKTIIKVFPEEKGNSSVVFSLEYSPIYDNFTQNKVFGEREAQKYLLEQIAVFEKAMVSR